MSSWFKLLRYNRNSVLVGIMWNNKSLKGLGILTVLSDLIFGLLLKRILVFFLVVFILINGIVVIT